jgi:hypothetical protein
MAVDEASVRSLATKLATFAETLDPQEEHGLGELLEAARRATNDARATVSAEDLLSSDTDFAALDEANQAAEELGASQFGYQAMSTPLTTVVTTITVIQSNPIIGCAGGHSNNSAAAAKLKSEIDAEETELAHERMRLPDTGPEERIQLERTIAEREAHIADLERQLEGLG